MTIKALRDDFEHALHADVRRAYSLPARFYLDAAVFEREKGDHLLPALALRGPPLPARRTPAIT